MHDVGMHVFIFTTRLLQGLPGAGVEKVWRNELEGT
jgi:hypothetical protein